MFSLTDNSASTPHYVEVIPANIVYEVFNDRGTGSHSDITVWRGDTSKNPGYFSLGDIAVDSFDQWAPPVFLVRAPGDELKPPVDYHHIWSDHGSGGHTDFSFWEPVPPSGYTCLGGVGQVGYNKPSTDLIRCI